MILSPAAAQSERAFQSAVLQLAHLQGFKTFHAHDSRRQIKPGVLVGDKDAAGFPDLVLCRPPRLIVAELKSERGRLRPEQREWLDLLAAVPSVEVFEWRPADWRDIERVLAR
jgi:hypothetical protein